MKVNLLLNHYSTMYRSLRKCIFPSFNGLLQMGFWFRLLAVSAGDLRRVTLFAARVQIR